MTFLWIGFIWLTIMIFYYALKWFKEKRKRMITSRRIGKHSKERMKMSISERLKYKERMIKK